MIRLVASDIDGTLLRNGARSIAPVLFDQIRRLGERGIRFCPASGRQYSSLRRLFAPVAGELSYLCENGAVVWGAGSPGAVLSKAVMERSRALALCGAILAQPRCEVLISGANTSYLCPKEPDIVDHMRYFVGNNVTMLNSPEEVPEDMVKVSAYCRDGAAAMAPVLSPGWEDFHPAIAGEKWLDFTLADKGIGLKSLCAALGVDLSEVMAFGDNDNDLPMLSLVGRPYIMEQASPLLTERFSRRCASVESVLEAFLTERERE